MFDHPLATEERDGVLRGVLDGDEVNESMRLVRREANSAVMVGEFIEPGFEAGQRKGAAGHAAKQTHYFAPSKRMV